MASSLRMRANSLRLGASGSGSVGGAAASSASPLIAIFAAFFSRLSRMASSLRMRANSLRLGASGSGSVGGAAAFLEARGSISSFSHRDSLASVAKAALAAGAGASGSFSFFPREATAFAFPLRRSLARRADALPSLAASSSTRAR